MGWTGIWLRSGGVARNLDNRQDLTRKNRIIKTAYVQVCVESMIHTRGLAITDVYFLMQSQIYAIKKEYMTIVP